MMIDRRLGDGIEGNVPSQTKGFDREDGETSGHQAAELN